MWGFCLCLVLGVAFVIAAGVFGVLSAGQAGEISAYHHARVCLAGASPDADCLQTVAGGITGVTEYGGKNADYALDIQTSSQALHITFTSDSPMLGYAVDGNPAVVTMWRGIPVSVSADGRSAATASVPDTAFAKDLGECAQSAGVGIFLVLGAVAMRRNRRVGRQPITRPIVAAAFLALGLGGFVLLIGGVALGGKPSRLGPDAAATGAALVVVLALSAWLGISVKRRSQSDPAALAFHASRAQVPLTDAPLTDAPLADAPARMSRVAIPPRARMQRTLRSPGLRANAVGWVLVLLTVGVLFGVFLTEQDGPPARAYRHAPACAGEANLATCVGEFTATVNGIRTDTQSGGSNYADVSYVSGDGVINAWARFDGDGGALARAAQADESMHTPLTIKVWRGAIIGAELGDAWHWANGNPPGVVIPAVFLAVCFAGLLLIVRLRIHRRSASPAQTSLAHTLPAQSDSQRLILEDLGQAAAAAGAIALLAYGFWPGAVVAVATLAWLGLSARRSAHARKLAMLSSLIS
jgi:hypothetical protein